MINFINNINESKVLKVRSTYKSINRIFDKAGYYNDKLSKEENEYRQKFGYKFEDRNRKYSVFVIYVEDKDTKNKNKIKFFTADRSAPLSTELSDAKLLNNGGIPKITQTLSGFNVELIDGKSYNFYGVPVMKDQVHVGKVTTDFENNYYIEEIY